MIVEDRVVEVVRPRHAHELAVRAVGEGAVAVVSDEAQRPGRVHREGVGVDQIGVGVDRRQDRRRLGGADSRRDRLRHRRVVRPGDRHRHRLRRAAAVIVGNRHKVALSLRLARGQEVKGAVRHREGPRHRPGHAPGAVRHRADRKGAEIAGPLRDGRRRVGVGEVEILEGDRSCRKIGDRAVQRRRALRHRPARRRQGDRRHIVRAGERHQDGLHRRCAVIVRDRHVVGLNYLLTRRQEVKRAIRRREGPADRAGHATGAVLQRPQRQAADITHPLRDDARRVRIRRSRIGEQNRPARRIEDGAARDPGKLRHGAGRRRPRRDHRRMDRTD